MAEGSSGGGPAGARPGILTLLRHGESEWNHERRFTGWSDVDLSRRGAAEARRAGFWLARSVRPVDLCFTSALRRAQRTAEIALDAMGLHDVALQQSWRLNERHYGDLEGRGIWSAVARHGVVTVLRCRRRYRTRPPAVPLHDARHPAHDPRYAFQPAHLLPHGESVADTQARLLPCWRDCIVPQLASGRHVLFVSHKHTLRALFRLLHERAPGSFQRCPLRTGVPVVLRFTDSDRWMFEPDAWCDRPLER